MFTHSDVILASFLDLNRSIIHRQFNAQSLTTYHVHVVTNEIIRSRMLTHSLPALNDDSKGFVSARINVNT